MTNKNLQAAQEFVREKVAKAANHNLADFTETMIDGFGDPVLTIIDYPLTLARVLNALPCEYYHNFHDGYLEYMVNGEENSIKWKFLNEDGTDCTFEQQEESVQLAIAKLLGFAGGCDE